MVSLSFTPRGAALFEMATGEHVGKRLAIVLDGTIHSAPVIHNYKMIHGLVRKVPRTEVEVDKTGEAKYQYTSYLDEMM